MKAIPNPYAEPPIFDDFPAFDLYGYPKNSCEIDECGTVHDRDVNSAKLILRRGLASLVEGAPHV